MTATKKKDTLSKPCHIHASQIFLCIQVYISEMSSPQAPYCLRILGCNKAVSFPHKNVLKKKKRKIRKKKKKVCYLSQPVLLLQHLQTFPVHLLNQSLGSLLTALLIKDLILSIWKRRRKEKRKENSCHVRFLLFGFVF